MSDDIYVIDNSTEDTPKPKRGRPRGKASKPPQVTTAASQCPSCGSTDRAPYTNKRMLSHATTWEGKLYSKVVWRNTRCLQCGQSRVDRTLEN